MRSHKQLHDPVTGDFIRQYDLETLLQNPKTSESGCWIWPSRPNCHGYGRVRVNGHQKLSHVVVYERLRGPVPDGLELDHLCRNPICCNPDHLEPVPHRVNSLRGEGYYAKNARKTHCPQGHPYDAENTYHWRNHRLCKACRRIRRGHRSRMETNHV